MPVSTKIHQLKKCTLQFSKVKQILLSTEKTQLLESMDKRTLQNNLGVKHFAILK